MDPNERPPLRQLYEKAKARAVFLASALADHQRRHGWDDQQLCAHLRCASEALPKLGLCGLPDPTAPDLAARVRRIADYVPCDADALLPLLREAGALAALRPATTNESSSWLLAARDRREADDDPSDAPPDEPQESPS